jgi:hypothetical protein
MKNSLSLDIADQTKFSRQIAQRTSNILEVEHALGYGGCLHRPAARLLLTVGLKITASLLCAGS